MFIEYVLIFKYFIFSFIVAVILLSLSYFLVYQNPNSEKLSIYECGFSPFEDSRGRFEVRFYIVAILFMIFDLEIVFLFPWIIIFNNISYIMFLTMIIFLLILFIGFFYELFKGALDWDNVIKFISYI